MDKLLNALRETLAQLGLDEQAIEAALQEAVAKAEGEEKPVPPSDPLANPDEVVVPPNPNPEGNEGEGAVPPASEPNPAEIPPADGQVPQGELVPPVPPVPPTPGVPPFDPTELIAQVSELQGKLDEQLKANEGLLARVQSLEDALKAAGVIDGSVASQIGDDIPKDNPGSPTEDVFANVLNELNGGRRY